jgi:hypothetical protein
VLVCDEVEDAKIFKEPRYVRLECARSLAVTTLLNPTHPPNHPKLSRPQMWHSRPKSYRSSIHKTTVSTGRYCPDRFSLVRPCI